MAQRKKVALPKADLSQFRTVAISKEWVIDPAHLQIFKTDWERKVYGTMLRHRSQMAKIESQLKVVEGKLAADMAKLFVGR